MLLAASGGKPRVDQVTTISLAVRSGSGRRVPKSEREREKGRENNTRKTILKFCRKKIQFATYNSYVRKYKIRMYVYIHIYIYRHTNSYITYFISKFCCAVFQFAVLLSPSAYHAPIEL